MWSSMWIFSCSSTFCWKAYSVPIDLPWHPFHESVAGKCCQSLWSTVPCEVAQYSDSLALGLHRRQGSRVLREPCGSQGRLTKGCCSDNQRTHQTQKDARAEHVQNCESGEAGEGGGGDTDMQSGAQVAGLGTVLRGSDFVLHAVGSQRVVSRGCEVSRPVISEKAAWQHMVNSRGRDQKRWEWVGDCGPVWLRDGEAWTRGSKVIWSSSQMDWFLRTYRAR